MSNRPYCPECGSPVVYDLACATHEQGGRWVAHLSCDSAIVYACIGETCEWGHVDGMNPANPRGSKNAAQRPVWLEGWDLDGPHGVRAYPGVAYAWESTR